MWSTACRTGGPTFTSRCATRAAPTASCAWHTWTSLRRRRCCCLTRATSSWSTSACRRTTLRCLSARAACSACACTGCQPVTARPPPRWTPPPPPRSRLRSPRTPWAEAAWATLTLPCCACTTPRSPPPPPSSTTTWARARAPPRRWRPCWAGLPPATTSRSARGPPRPTACRCPCLSCTGRAWPSWMAPTRCCSTGTGRTRSAMTRTSLPPACACWTAAGCLPSRTSAAAARWAATGTRTASTSRRRTPSPTSSPPQSTWCPSA
mmetsp:Transcript_19394/g.49356  ORF Transcript_19394/g.49356 Transcript_19394/m.49356 type:complete len:265 (+) Transcript_19394:1277-2071(+)